jgi:hypothetical protein
MKKVNFAIIFFVCLWLLCVIGNATAYGQTKVTQDKSGNYTAVTNTNNAKGSKAVLTGKYFTDSKSIKYPVYKSVNGKLFYIKTSKAGNKYNVYLTVK